MSTVKIRFYLKGDKVKSEETAIYGKIIVFGTLATFSTGEYILANRWKATNGLSKTLRIDKEISLKEHLDTIKENYKKVYIELSKTTTNITDITANDIKDYLNGKSKSEEDKTTILDVLNLHNEHFKLKVAKGERAEGSKEKYIRMAEVIKEYLNLKYKVKDFNFSKIDANFVWGLDFYLRNERKHGIKVGLGNNTTVKYIRNISSMINYGKKRGKVNSNPFNIYDEKIEDVETVFLTKDELEKIETKQFSSRRLEIIKDIFLFSCYTSYAPADAMKLTWNNIITDAKGDMWIMALRTKTKIQSNIPVRPTLKKILNKYKADPECIETGRILPLRSNAKTNEYLKEIADLCGIEKNLTWYVSRHTFATTVTLGNKVSMETVSKMMGHKRITQTQHYGKILDDNVKDEMQKVN